MSALSGGKTDWGLGLFFPLSRAPPPFPHLNRKENAPSINTRPMLTVCHHNKLEVRPALLETEPQVLVAKHKRSLFPTDLLTVRALPKSFWLFPHLFSLSLFSLNESFGKVATDSKSFPLSQTSKSALHRHTLGGLVPRSLHHHYKLQT